VVGTAEPGRAEGISRLAQGASCAITHSGGGALALLEAVISCRLLGGHIVGIGKNLLQVTLQPPTEKSL